MAHIFINHHFFFENGSFRDAFKGPTPHELERQLSVLIDIAKPASMIIDSLNSDKNVFSITIDDSGGKIKAKESFMFVKVENTYALTRSSYCGVLKLKNMRKCIQIMTLPQNAQFLIKKNTKNY